MLRLRDFSEPAFPPRRRQTEPKNHERGGQAQRGAYRYRMVFQGHRWHQIRDRMQTCLSGTSSLRTFCWTKSSMQSWLTLDGPTSWRTCPIGRWDSVFTPGCRVLAVWRTLSFSHFMRCHWFHMQSGSICLMQLLKRWSSGACVGAKHGFS